LFVFVELFLVSVFEDLLLFEYLANFVLLFPAFAGVLVATVDTFIFLIAVAGGYILAKKALKPIDDITTMARTKSKWFSQILINQKSKPYLKGLLSPQHSKLPLLPPFL